jgi:hypothetical protein
MALASRVKRGLRQAACKHRTLAGCAGAGDEGEEGASKWRTAEPRRSRDTIRAIASGLRVGKKQKPQHARRAGTVSGVSGYQCFVRFDGNKDHTTLHDSYLEHVPEQD